ncbi:hypothetical protein, partial [Pseudomonas syringae group genomosp. 7]|uniref:hypothetical protein n=1 Tax=Pseudomonas syringae group genomosp. 7 TaxID=251699 RepID=UPI0037703624
MLCLLFVGCLWVLAGVVCVVVCFFVVGFLVVAVDGVFCCLVVLVLFLWVFVYFWVFVLGVLGVLWVLFGLVLGLVEFVCGVGMRH